MTAVSAVKQESLDSKALVFPTLDVLRPAVFAYTSCHFRPYPHLSRASLHYVPYSTLPQWSRASIDLTISSVVSSSKRTLTERQQ